MDHAGLNHGIGPGRFYGLRQAREPVTADNEDILDTPVSEVGTHAGPETRAFSVLYPDPQAVFDAFHVNTHR